MRGSDSRTGRCSAMLTWRIGFPRGIRCAGSGRSSMPHWPSSMASSRRSTRSKGRPSIAPERLLRAALMQILFSVRSERQLMEQMQYNLLFRWFVGLGDRRCGLGADRVHQEPRPPADDGHRAQVPGGDPGARGGRAAAVGRAFLRRRHAGPGLGLDEELQAESRSRSRRRRPRRSAAAACRTHRRAAQPNSGKTDTARRQRQDGDDRHDSADADGRNAEVDFRGQKRSNETHASVTDPDARLTAKARASRRSSASWATR